MSRRGSGDRSDEECVSPSKAVGSQKFPYKRGMVPQDHTISSNQSYPPAPDARQYPHYGQSPYLPVAQQQYDSVYPTQPPAVAGRRYTPVYAPGGPPQYGPNLRAPPSGPISDSSSFSSGAGKSAGSTSKQPYRGNGSNKVYHHKTRCAGCGQNIPLGTTDSDEPLLYEYEYDEKRRFYKSTSFFHPRTGTLVKKINSDGGLEGCRWHTGVNN